MQAQIMKLGANLRSDVTVLSELKTILVILHDVRKWDWRHWTRLWTGVIRHIDVIHSSWQTCCGKSVHQIAIKLFVKIRSFQDFLVGPKAGIARRSIFLSSLKLWFEFSTRPGPSVIIFPYALYKILGKTF